MQKYSKQDTVYDIQLLDHRKLTSLMQFGDLESCADTFEAYLAQVHF